MSIKPIRIVAHRGWSTLFPENSLAAIAAAWAAGAEEVEYDVRLSKDGVPVLCHDATVDRVSTLTGPCGAHTWSELAAADIVGPSGVRYAGMGFAGLAQALDLFGGKMVMNVHIKEAEAVPQAIKLFRERGLGADDYYIAGDVDVLEAARSLAPEIPRCCLAYSRIPDRMLECAIEYGCRRVQFRWDHYDASYVRKCLDLGLLPNLYYADDPDGADRAVEAGIAALLTNDVGPIKLHVKGDGRASA